MTTDPIRRPARLADVERYLAVERRHVIAMTAQLDKARGLGWEDGVIRAEDLLGCLRLGLLGLNSSTLGWSSAAEAEGATCLRPARPLNCPATAAAPLLAHRR
jgi:hypothetical protein